MKCVLRIQRSSGNAQQTDQNIKSAIVSLARNEFREILLIIQVNY